MRPHNKSIYTLTLRHILYTHRKPQTRIDKKLTRYVRAVRSPLQIRGKIRAFAVTEYSENSAFVRGAFPETKKGRRLTSDLRSFRQSAYRFCGVSLYRMMLPRRSLQRMSAVQHSESPVCSAE